MDASKQDGKIENKKEVAQSLNKIAMPTEQIALVLNVDINTVKKWLEVGMASAQDDESACMRLTKRRGRRNVRPVR